MFKKMLVPLDGSLLAEEALPYVLQLTDRLRLETTLLYVCNKKESQSIFMCQSYIEHVVEKLKLQLEETKKKRPGLESEPPVAIHGEAVSGDVSVSILEYAAKIETDLILMSRHGHSGIGRWLMGSITHKVLISSPVPVLIVQPDNHFRVWESEWPKTILVLLDGSRLSEAVLDYVEVLNRQMDSRIEVTLFEVCEPPDLLGDYPEAIMPLTWNEHVSRAKAASAQKCSTYLSQIQSRLTAKGIKVHNEVTLAENVYSEIIRYIRAHYFDLVIMTTHGRSGFSEWPYGHVADRIMQVCSSSLLLVRPARSKASSSTNS